MRTSNYWNFMLPNIEGALEIFWPEWFLTIQDGMFSWQDNIFCWKYWLFKVGREQHCPYIAYKCHKNQCTSNRPKKQNKVACKSRGKESLIWILRKPQWNIFSFKCCYWKKQNIVSVGVSNSILSSYTFRKMLNFRNISKVNWKSKNT